MVSFLPFYADTVCVADQSKTTASPTTPPITTPSPTTTPTPTPTPTLPTPTTGNYTVNVNSSACLLANFGLRIGVKLGDVRLPVTLSSGDPQVTLTSDRLLVPSLLEQKYEELNLDPNATSVSGSCGVDSSQLVLVSDTMNVTFTFTNVSPQPPLVFAAHKDKMAVCSRHRGLSPATIVNC